MEEESFFDLQTLPSLVAENIATNLQGRDLINLGRTCKFWYNIVDQNSVWKVLVKTRFGGRIKELQEPTEQTKFKELYFKLATSKKPVADFGYILHLNGRYLEKIQDPESTFGTVIHLKTVCWLQLNGCFSGVLPGKYRFLWRMKLQNAYMNCQDSKHIEFVAKPEANCGDELRSRWSEEKVHEAERYYGSGQWFIADMGEVCVKALCKVQTIITARIGYWCGGFFWDYVELKPVGQLSEPTLEKHQGTPRNRRGKKPNSVMYILRLIPTP